MNNLDYSRVKIDADARHKAIKKNIPFIVLEKIMQITENEIIMDSSPFFYE